MSKLHIISEIIRNIAMGFLIVELSIATGIWLALLFKGGI